MDSSGLSQVLVFFFLLGTCLADLDASVYLKHLNSTEEILSLSPRVDDLPPCWRSYKEKSSYARRKVIEGMIPKIREGVNDLIKDDGSGWFAAVKDACEEAQDDPLTSGLFVPMCYSLSQRREEGFSHTREQVIARYDLFMEFIEEFSAIVKQELKFLDSHINSGFSLEEDANYHECLNKQVGVLEAHLEKVDAKARGINQMFLKKRAAFVNMADTFLDWRDVVVSTEIIKPAFDHHCDEAEFMSGVLNSVNQCLEVALEEKRNRPVVEISEPTVADSLAETEKVVSVTETSWSEAVSSTKEAPSSGEVKADEVTEAAIASNEIIKETTVSERL